MDPIVGIFREAFAKDFIALFGDGGSASKRLLCEVIECKEEELANRVCHRIVKPPAYIKADHQCRQCMSMSMMCTTVA